MIIDKIRSRKKKVLKESERKEAKEGLVIACEACGKNIIKSELVKNQYVCTCGYPMRIDARTRLDLISDAKSFREYDRHLVTKNILDFPGYDQKVEKLKDFDEVVTGTCRIDGKKCVVAVMDSYFMMGSMGSVVGEKITRAIEKATRLKLPLIIFTASGGARMQEGIFSLMQMAKTSAALKKHDEAGLLCVTVLTHPTTGGVTASFAMLGDIILSEPQALIGFAGPRVIKQTIKTDLPERFQTAEFVLEKGFVDRVVPRKDMKDVLGRLLVLHG